MPCRGGSRVSFQCWELKLPALLLLLLRLLLEKAVMLPQESSVAPIVGGELPGACPSELSVRWL